jgi:hypothetical protein
MILFIVAVSGWKIRLYGNMNKEALQEHQRKPEYVSTYDPLTFREMG